MVQIIQLQGTDKRLYELVAPLVMNPEILKQNYNYPFRTSEDFCLVCGGRQKESHRFYTGRGEEEGVCHQQLLYRK